MTFLLLKAMLSNYCNTKSCGVYKIMVNPYHNSPVTTASSRRSCVFTACWRWSRQRRYSKTDEQFDVNKSDEDDAILRITTAICRWVLVNSRVRRRANLSSYADNNIPVSSVVTAVHHQPKQHAPSRQQYIPSMYPRDQATAATTSKEMRVGKLSSRVRIAKLRRAAVSVRPSVCASTLVLCPNGYTYRHFPPLSF